jgi:hypothetical protein
MCRRRCEKQSRNRSFRPPKAGRRPEDQLLVRIRGSTVDRAVHEVGILRFEIARVLDERTDDARPEPGRHLFEVIPDPPDMTVQLRF